MLLSMMAREWRGIIKVIKGAVFDIFKKSISLDRMYPSGYN